MVAATGTGPPAEGQPPLLRPDRQPERRLPVALPHPPGSQGRGFAGELSRVPLSERRQRERKGGARVQEKYIPPTRVDQGPGSSRNRPRPAQTLSPSPSGDHGAQAPRAVGTVWAWHELSVTDAGGGDTMHPTHPDARGSQEESPLGPWAPRELEELIPAELPRGSPWPWQLVSVREVPGHGGI